MSWELIMTGTSISHMSGSLEDAQSTRREKWGQWAQLCEQHECEAPFLDNRNVADTMVQDVFRWFLQMLTKHHAYKNTTDVLPGQQPSFSYCVNCLLDGFKAHHCPGKGQNKQHGLSKTTLKSPDFIIQHPAQQGTFIQQYLLSISYALNFTRS